MAIRLTKRNSVIFAVVIVVLCGSLGYLVWRVNQPETTAPTESEAGVGATYTDYQACLHDVMYGQPCSCSEEGNKECYGFFVTCQCSTGKYFCKDCMTPGNENPCDYISNQGSSGPVGSACDESNCGGPCGVFTYKCGSRCYDRSCGAEACKEEPSPYCGDSKVNVSGEECDPPNNPCTKDGHSGKCSSTCKCVLNPSCGNKVVEEGEECDPPNMGCIPEDIIVVPEGDDSMVTAPGICTSECKCVPRSYCGDGKVDSGEECDPPNTKCYNYCDPPGSECAIKDGYGMCTNTCQCEFVIPSSCGNGKLDTGEECENGNPSGVKCQWSSCNTESCKCIQSIVGVSKSVSEKCVNVGTADPRAELTYTILVKDIGRGEVIETIEDVLDPKVVSKGLIPTDISHNGRYSNGKIIWEGIAIQFARNPDSTISVPFTYKLTIDKSNFGVYTNNVTLTTTKGNTFQASATINADCIVTAPQTGIFDSTLGRIAGGFGLIVLGGFVYSMPSRVFMFNRQSDERRRNKYRVRFESKIFKK